MGIPDSSSKWNRVPFSPYCHVALLVPGAISHPGDRDRNLKVILDSWLSPMPTCGLLPSPGDFICWTYIESAPFSPTPPPRPPSDPPCFLSGYGGRLPAALPLPPPSPGSAQTLKQACYTQSCHVCPCVRLSVTSCCPQVAHAPLAGSSRRPCVCTPSRSLSCVFQLPPPPSLSLLLDPHTGGPSPPRSARKAPKAEGPEATALQCGASDLSRGHVFSPRLTGRGETPAQL